MSQNAKLVKRKAFCHAENAFLSRLELINSLYMFGFTKSLKSEYLIGFVAF